MNIQTINSSDFGRKDTFFYPSECKILFTFIIIKVIIVIIIVIIINNNSNDLFLFTVFFVMLLIKCHSVREYLHNLIGIRKGEKQASTNETEEERAR